METGCGWNTVVENENHVALEHGHICMKVGVGLPGGNERHGALDDKVHAGYTRGKSRIQKNYITHKCVWAEPRDMQETLQAIDSGWPHIIVLIVVMHRCFVSPSRHPCANRRNVRGRRWHWVRQHSSQGQDTSCLVVMLYNIEYRWIPVASMWQAGWRVERRVT